MARAVGSFAGSTGKAGGKSSAAATQQPCSSESDNLAQRQSCGRLKRFQVPGRHPKRARRG